MVECARCGRDVDELQSVTPDIISKDLIDSIDQGEKAVAGAGDLAVCAECMEDLKTE